MAKFKYRMQSILDIKSKLEEQAKLEFSQARARLDEEEAKLFTFNSRRERYMEEGRRLRNNSLKVMDIIENKAAIQRMEEYIQTQKLRVKKAEDNLEAARIKMQTAIQERKTQDKLKEHAFEDFMQEEKAAESKEVDELTSYTYGQKEERNGNG